MGHKFLPLLGTLLAVLLEQFIFNSVGVIDKAFPIKLNKAMVPFSSEPFYL